MTGLFEHYRTALLGTSPPSPSSEALLISSSGRLATYYAPFDHVNPRARLVLLGITPGRHQAAVGIAELRRALGLGFPAPKALEAAKSAASFSGPMRHSLTQMLDFVGTNRALGVTTCDELFRPGLDLVHFTSAIRYPVFADGDNYSGSPPILKTPYLEQMLGWLKEEAEHLRGAFWVPLGREPAAVLRHFAGCGLLSRQNILFGLPHPSGANAERIAYFLGRKPKSLLSSKTRPEPIDDAKRQLQQQLESI